MFDITEIGSAARCAAVTLNNSTGGQRKDALFAIADALEQNCDAIIKENLADIAAGREKGMSESLIDRLMLDKARLFAVADAVRSVANLNDPIGETVEIFARPNGLLITKKRVPMGVIAIIYEARPNVTVDAAALCLKTANAVILRGGSEAFNTNKILVSIMQRAIESVGLSGDSVQMLPDTSREGATALMRMNGYVDLLIPRGSKRLIASVIENATVPVIETGAGNCHIYVDESADAEMAAKIVFNAKTSRPSVCNAAEKLLIHENAAKDILPVIAKKLSEKSVELRGDEKARSILKDIKPASEDDWATEYGDYIMAIKVVSSIDEAIAHINAYGTRHSEAIITKSAAAAQKFMREVDAAAVYHNASTRFTDGGEFGFGAEIGISTQKMHARGPMGLREITTYKYLIEGNGQIR